jgi:serine/threonine-protein kinase 11
MKVIGRSQAVSSVSLVSRKLPSSQSIPQLKKINRYTLRAKIGTGSSSSVYLAIDNLTNEKYAIKRIRLRELARTSSGVAQLEREIRLMKLFDHKNIVKIEEVLHSPALDEAYLVLEYAERGSLGSLIERGLHLPYSVIFSIMKQILLAVKYLHACGYVHQDIKPSNILIDANGVAKLADFGIGHSFDSAAMVVGSPAYQAPEALYDSYVSDDESDSGESPQKEDIWALGVTLYQLLFLKLPFVGDNLYEIVNRIKERELQIPSPCEEIVADLLRRMLTVEPGKRIGVDDALAHPLIANAPESAEELPEALEIQLKNGHIINIEARVCGDGYSFATTPLSVPRRFSYHVYGRDSVQPGSLSPMKTQNATPGPLNT